MIETELDFLAAITMLITIVVILILCYYIGFFKENYEIDFSKKRNRGLP
ncbi:MAG: hypothetical protein [Lokiarchaeia virus VerdaV1]|uniref:Uncharacterized protein n=1 Tax=Lokiarchaeia virus VerdaV1 TaxID=3070170 RepID=A0AA35CNL4_9CAUD|nr:MAG: hypothetical protein QIT41_gp38 [Lokiarchaeia virus VerdaV1]BDI54887.1 MAG: hypothetical protein [Lokiarchaeia virus VerdaV1]